ncbi:MAG: alpha/beta hydrolase fold domain-containing protein, partial [Bacillota bacterium]|nr:alpha/beta hydrolase fold domain-containing protein [Bacillota bacterium]
MLYLHVNNKTIRGSLAKQLLRLGKLLPHFADHGPVNLGKLFTTEVSADYRWPKDLTAAWIPLKYARLEFVSAKRGKSPNVILQFHGGAYVSGYSDMYRKSAVKYYRISCGTDVVSLDYRLAPENPYPAALEDAVESYRYLLHAGYPADHIIV